MSSGNWHATEPGPEPVAGRVRGACELSALFRAATARGPRPEARDEELPSPAETVTVWRCQDCGGVDAPQPCIDVCIWGPADWVEAAPYDSAQSRAAVDREAERSLAGLLRRFAFTTPRDGQWEPGWRAFQSQARIAFPAGNSQEAADGGR